MQDVRHEERLEGRLHSRVPHHTRREEGRHGEGAISLGGRGVPMNQRQTSVEWDKDKHIPFQNRVDEPQDGEERRLGPVASKRHHETRCGRHRGRIVFIFI